MGAKNINRQQTEDQPVKKLYAYDKEARKEGDPWFKGWSNEIEDLGNCHHCSHNDIGNLPKLEYPPANTEKYLKVKRTLTLIKYFVVTGFIVLLYFLFLRFTNKNNY